MISRGNIFERYTAQAFFFNVSAMTAADQEFGNAIAAMRPFLLRITTLQLQDKSSAEDVVQETLLAALMGQQRFEGRSSLKTWVLSILRYKTLDTIRDRKRMRPVPAADSSIEDECNLEPFEVLFDEKECWADAKDEWADPETVAERSDFFRILDTCLTQLPTRTSRAFLMREWLEAEPDEICQQLDLSPGNLRVLLYRARMQLRVCLDHKWER